MLGEYILKKALDASLDVVKKVLRESKTKLLTTRDELEQSIHIHLKSVKNWSGEVSFSDIKQAKRTTDVYIELDLYVYPIHRRISRTEQIQNNQYEQEDCERGKYGAVAIQFFFLIPVRLLRVLPYPQHFIYLK